MPTLECLPHDSPMCQFFNCSVCRAHINMKADASSTMSSPISQPPPSATGTGNMENAPSPSGSEESHQPEKAPAVPAYQTFGPDPTKFNDPTIYHIRDITEETPEDLKKEILGVARYPKSELQDLTPGTPPDRDFSNPKPQTQVNAGVFANYVEPYVRPLTEEDMSFLKERVCSNLRKGVLRLLIYISRLIVSRHSKCPVVARGTTRRSGLTKTEPWPLIPQLRSFHLTSLVVAWI